MISFLNGNRAFKIAGQLAVVVVLHGCALPGFGILKSSIGKDGEARSNYIIGYKPVVEEMPSNGDSPGGALTEITPDLVRSMNGGDDKKVSPAVTQLFGKAAAYTIGAGDVVGVVVYDHPELLPNAGAVISQQADPTAINVAPGFIVSSTGEVSFPYIGRIKLAGLTEIEASSLVTEKISKYIKDPQVTVRIQSYRSRRAYIEGEVKTPGVQIFTDIPMTLAEAISRAGGVTSAGDRSYITLSRGNSTTRIDLQTLAEAGIDPSRIPLENGDVLNVRSRDESKVYVMGEVARPSALLMRNGRLSLNEAIGDSGGPNLATSNTGQIYVIRNNRSGNSELYHLNAKNPAALALADRFPLQPRDVVYIDPVELVMWNRVVSLILPSAQVVNLGTEAAAR